MIVKLIILFIIIWFGVRIYLAIQAKKTKNTSVKRVEDMVSCVTCGVHIPIDEAINVDNQYFCSKDHLPTKPQD